MPAQDKDLQPVDDLKMVQRYLKYGLEFREPVACFIEDADVRFEAYIQSVDGSRLALDLEITEDSFAKLDSNLLAGIDRPQGPIRVSYSVNEATFFVHAKIQGRTTRRFVVKADMPMYKLQRRETLRIKISDTHKATLVIGRETLPLFDLSAGGLSVIVPLSEEKLYRKQQSFPGCQLKFQGKEFKVDLIVKSVLGHGKDGLRAKVGFHFAKLPAAIENLIAREAYLYTHQIWSRWL